MKLGDITRDQATKTHSPIVFCASSTTSKARICAACFAASSSGLGTGFSGGFELSARGATRAAAKAKAVVGLALLREAVPVVRAASMATTFWFRPLLTAACYFCVAVVLSEALSAVERPFCITPPKVWNSWLTKSRKSEIAENYRPPNLVITSHGGPSEAQGTSMPEWERCGSQGSAAGGDARGVC